MKKIVVIGGANPDVLQLILDIARAGESWQVLGVLDDAMERGALVLDAPVLGPLESWRDLDSHVCFAQSIVSQPQTARSIVQRLKIPSERFPNLIHPTATVFQDGAGAARLGQGNLVLQGSSIQSGAVMGDYNYVNINCVVGHDAVVGDYNIFGVTATITGHCHVGEACYIGSGSVITNGAALGDQCFVCAGTVVPRTLKPGSKVMGNPLRMLPTSP
jgi:sugar O-acyltransferase (sialic acid O-acetyltransferase NeuD family)